MLRVVQRRWRWLFGFALVCLTGVAWLARTFQSSVFDWFNVDVLGMIGCAVIGLAGAITRSRKRWPAVIAVVCAAPLAASTLRMLGFFPRLVTELGPAVVLMFVGSLVTAGWALYLAVTPPPPERSEPIPPARVA